MTIEQVAQLCHAVNAEWCAMNGDSSQGRWEALPPELKRSSVEGVMFRMEHPTASARDQHDAWANHKIAQGWTYGPEKDPEKKTHPCLVPWESLPEDQRVKDSLFVGVVEACRWFVTAPPCDLPTSGG